MSSSPHADSEGYVHGVSFANGTDESVPYHSTYAVRCVKTSF